MNEIQDLKLENEALKLENEALKSELQQKEQAAQSNHKGYAVTYDDVEYHVLLKIFSYEGKTYDESNIHDILPTLLEAKVWFIVK